MKDLISTFLTTNVVAQHPSNNSGLWKSLEGFSQNLVKDKGKELYITAGGFGSYSQKPTLVTQDGLSNINVPETLWKVIVVLDRPNQSLTDFSSVGVNDRVIAIKVPNANTSGGGGKPSWSPYIVSVRQLENDLFNATGVKYDFLATLPQTIQDRYELQAYSGSLNVGGFLSSPLMGENLDGQETQLRHSLVSDTAIWHDRIQEDSLFQNMGGAGIGIGQIGISQIGSKEISPFQIYDVGQIGISQVGKSQISLTQNGISQNSISQIDFTEVGLRKINTSQDSSNQDSTSQIAFSNFGIPQIGSAQVDHSQIGSIESSSRQIDTTQVQANKIINPVPQIGIEIGKISLPSSITLQQFLSSHNFNLQNTTVPTWLDFLQGTTPFNLNIEIIDLPTGQLAEANITGFDPTGRPNSGTLYLDTDANGLGW
jgi:DNA/RNA non-specific endonuclease